MRRESSEDEELYNQVQNSLPVISVEERARRRKAKIVRTRSLKCSLFTSQRNNIEIIETLHDDIYISMI